MMLHLKCMPEIEHYVLHSLSTRVDVKLDKFLLQDNERPKWSTCTLRYEMEVF